MIDTARQPDALVNGTIALNLGNGQTVHGVSNSCVFLSAGSVAAGGVASPLAPSTMTSD